MTRMAFEDMSKTYHDQLRAQERVKAEVQQLRADLADPNAQVDHLHNQASGSEHNCLPAVRDRDVIRTHLAHLASGSFLLPSNVPLTASATPPIGEKSRSTDPNLPIKHPRPAMTRSVTKSVDNHSVKSTGESPRSTGPVQSAKSIGSDGPIKRPRAAKMTRSGTKAVEPLQPSQPVSLRDPPDQCDLPNLLDLMEHPLSLRDLPDQLALTSPKLRQDLHGFNRLKEPRVENDPPPKPEVTGLMSFRTAICLSPIKSRLTLL